MIVREGITLDTLTTLRVGGVARFVAECAHEGDVRDALALAKEHALPFIVLGEGSNIVASDDGYEGVIIRVTNDAYTVTEDGPATTLVCEAGMPWDALVREAAARELWGIENLAGIPGTVGAAPVQNIGAYGVEVESTLSYVEALDADTGQAHRIENDACAFGYRDSRFKRERNLVIMRVAFTLSHVRNPQLAYKDLAHLGERAETLTPALIGDAVREVRARKFPDIRVEGTAGSFFKNPVIGEAAYASLAEKYPELPGFPTPHGVKVPLAFVLDRILGLRGYANGRAHLFANQPLVLVTEQGATAHDVDRLADDVRTRVHDATGIDIEREVRSIPD